MKWLDGDFVDLNPTTVVQLPTVAVPSPNRDAIVQAFTAALRIIESQKASRQRSLAVTCLEEAFMHAVFSDASIDSPVRMR
jgi:hypothetical protein